MFAEIINTPATTAAWAEIKPLGSYPSCGIAMKANDDSTFLISLTGVDEDPVVTMSDKMSLSPGVLRLRAGVRIAYVKAVSAACTIETVIKRK